MVSRHERRSWLTFVLFARQPKQARLIRCRFEGSNLCISCVACPISTVRFAVYGSRRLIRVEEVAGT